MLAIAIDRSDCMEDVLRRQLSRSGHHRVSCGQSSDLLPDMIEAPHDLGPTGAMDRPVHSAAAGQRRVRRIHNRVGGDPRNIVLPHLNRSPRASLEFHDLIVSPARDTMPSMTRRDLRAAGGAACAARLRARSHIDKSRISAIPDDIGLTPDDAIAFAHKYGL